MEVEVCARDELVPGVVRVVELGLDPEGRPVQALVLRDENGRVVAYRNLCRHLPVPLDGGTGELLTPDRRHLVCGTHGALYRLGDGRCVEGPCKGCALIALPTREDERSVYVADGSITESKST
jgi:nitrite reductase/ring-hydroxylating ferredoxin subunit